jgi:hypothetical protein
MLELVQEKDSLGDREGLTGKRSHRVWCTSRLLCQDVKPAHPLAPPNRYHRKQFKKLLLIVFHICRVRFFVFELDFM